MNHTPANLLKSLVSFAALSFSAVGFAAPKSIPTPISAREFCSEFETSAAKDKKIAPSAQAQCIELINSGVNQARFSFNASIATACLDAQKKGQPLTVCRGVLFGTLPANHPCESSNDCRSPNICTGSRASHAGRCSAPLGLGAACDSEALGSSAFSAAAMRSECAAGSHCAMGKEQICSKD